MPFLSNNLSTMKKLNFSKATVSLWIVNRHTTNREATYNLKWIDIGENLADKLKDIVVNKIIGSNKVAEYDFVSTDQDEELLGISADETDFIQILEIIENGTENDKVESFQELSKAWAYIIKLQLYDNTILGFKRITSKGELKKANWFVNAAFRDKRFVDIEEEEIFKIEKSIDFFCYKNELFILNKKDFEIGLNFREGMIAKSNNLLEEFEKLKIVDNIAHIKNYVGNNLTFLRKLATINKNGYFRHNNFLTALEKVNTKEKWGLQFKNGSLNVNEDNIELILIVLNKDRLKDLIEGETFDVAVKKQVIK